MINQRNIDTGRSSRRSARSAAITLLGRCARPSVALITLGLSACSVGPHLTLAPAAAPDHYTRTPTGGATTPHQAFDWTAAQNAAWWQMFHSTVLNALIAKSFAQNPTLAAARDALTASNNYAVAQRGAFFPSIGLGGGLQRDTALRSIVGGRVVVPGKPFTLAAASGEISYNTDVFGLEGDLYRNARARAAVSAAAVQEAKIFLAGNVATAAIALAGDQAELQLRRQIVAAQTQVLGVMTSDYRFGSISDESVQQQKSVLAANKAALPLITARRDDARHRLNYLIGQAPDQPIPHLSMQDLIVPSAIPVVVPSVLVEHRPDIVAAMAAVTAASAAVDASTAAMYPNITLSGSFGAGSAAALFNPVSEIFTLASSFAAPLFEGGTLSADKRAAYATWQQTTAQYKNTVLLAFNQVADGLRDLQGAEASLEQRKAAADFAGTALRIARKRYDAGAITYQTLLNAELLAQSDQVAELTEQVTCYQDLVTLFVAMGDTPPSASPATVKVTRTP
ncbi:efflux transporter outer membrane subunit [Acidiphilium sp.]|uniref:efflux transporter outer membrane subunit n=1 Tax=Acidiphilium sp. TaxID=527 RepID=UPI003D0871B2